MPPRFALLPFEDLQLMLRLRLRLRRLINCLLPFVCCGLWAWRGRHRLSLALALAVLIVVVVVPIPNTAAIFVANNFTAQTWLPFLPLPLPLSLALVCALALYIPPSIALFCLGQILMSLSPLSHSLLVCHFVCVWGKSRRAIDEHVKCRARALANAFCSAISYIFDRHKSVRKCVCVRVCLCVCLCVPRLGQKSIMATALFKWQEVQTGAHVA